MATVEIEWGAEALRLVLPDGADVLRLPQVAPCADPARAVRGALARPIGAAPLRDLALRTRAAAPAPTAAIVVSDNTRPVPYCGPGGILAPLLDVLRGVGGFRILLLVATGTHRALSSEELRRLLCPEAFAPDVTIVSHDARNAAALRFLGRTPRGTEAWINAAYLDADLKILTGLVEPHFMAGVSGGRKSICPGLVGEKTTYVFHGAPLMADPRSDSLVLEGNPCHEEALAVARMAGADFIANATLDRFRRLTGVYAGDLVAAHEAAARRADDMFAIPIARTYDLVVTHAGYVGINHYQAAKAAVEAAKALRRGGSMILAANHTDADPVGGPRYAALLPLLKRLGPEEFTRRLLSPEWGFVPEQWEVQMWCRALRHLEDMRRLTYCSPQLTGAVFRERGLFGRDGGEGLHGLKGRDLAEAMVQRALDGFLARHPEASVAVLPDGPYGVPRLEPGQAAPNGDA